MLLVTCNASELNYTWTTSKSKSMVKVLCYWVIFYHEKLARVPNFENRDQFGRKWNLYYSLNVYKGCTAKQNIPCLNRPMYTHRVYIYTGVKIKIKEKRNIRVPIPVFCIDCLKFQCEIKGKACT